jgi:hypothetical protein
MRRPGGLAGLLVAAATALLLTGCVKVDIHLKVATDDTVSGTYVVGVRKSLLAVTNDNADSLYQRLTASARPGVRTTRYDDGTYVGATFAVSAVPIGQVGTLGTPDGSSGTNFSLTHTNGQFQFSATLDTSTAAGPNGAAPAGSEIRLTVTFPGRVVATNGHKHGSSVTWTPPLGRRVTVTATADDHAPPPAPLLDRVLYGLAGLSVLALLVVVAITFVARRHHGGRPPVF